MFDSLDAVHLSRAQFAFTVTVHFLFPAITIGLAGFLAVLNAGWLWTRDATYLTVYRFWLPIFALAFGMGVVSGLVMSYEIGTNWSGFADKVGPVIGPPMVFEVMSAFFLEAGFLGIMLFGRDRVSPALHMIACAGVALGTCMSAFWVLSANSWMHTPAGYEVDPETGQFLPTSFWLTIFNPSFPYRFLHTLVGAFLGTAFVVAGVGAFHLLRAGPANASARRMLSMATWAAVLLVPAQIAIGDRHGLNTLEHQPQKVMAMEGHYDSHPEGAPLYLFGIPNDRTQHLDYAIGIPRLGSLVLRHSLSAPLAGLDTIPDADQPPALIIFWSFRVMVGLGLLMLGLALWSVERRLRRRLYDTPAFLRAVLVMSPSGLCAIVAGWITTEVGRQPYVVYGLLRTSDAVAPLGAGTVAATLAAFVIVYVALFGAGVTYMLRLMASPPETPEPSPAPQCDRPVTPNLVSLPIGEPE